MPALETTHLVPLSGAGAADAVGGKAATLGELARAGIAVPEGFVLPVGASPIDGRHVPEAAELIERLGGALAVRSSATVEDGGESSFAGQFTSFLDVRDVDGVERAVLGCLGSATSEAVRAYCSARSIDRGAVKMAVLLQRMVRAEVAGVLFTVHPTRGDEREMLIEACAGTTDGVTSGRETGESILVRDGRATAAARLLTDGQVAELAQLGRRIERLQGSPQDVEWALEKGRFVVLQSRSITRLAFGAIDGQWTNADFRDGGVSSGSCAPLTWSLYERAWERALRGYLAELHLLDRGDDGTRLECARVFFGRPYWNLAAVKRCAQRLPGFIEREFDLDLAVQPLYEGDGARTPASLATLLRAIPTLFSAWLVFSSQKRIDRELLAMKPARKFEQDEPALARLTDDALTARFRELVDHAYLDVEANYFRTIFTASIAKLALNVSLEGLPVSYAKLVGGIAEVSHLRTAAALWRLGNDDANDERTSGVALRAFLAEHGHHGRRELDLREPRWIEEPEFLAEQARRLRGTEAPDERARRQRELFLEERARASRLLAPWRRHAFRTRLRRLRRYLWLREEMRDLSSRMHAAIRRLALEIGRRSARRVLLAHPEDVFFLRCDEVADALRRSFVATANARREQERSFRNFRAPNEIGRGFRLAPVERSGRSFCGIGCSPGVMTGRVRVVHSPAAAADFQRGDVLVCPHTDPGWTPLLHLAGAVVAENGGLLSHAALLCREFGIPAVLSVAGATRALRAGLRVRVDGETGHVDLVD